MSYGMKRTRLSEDVQERNIEDDLEDLINRVAEENSASSLKSRLSTLAGILEADLPNRQEAIFNIIIRCVKKQPNNIAVSSSIIAIININLYSQCGEFVDLVLKEFKECLLKHQLNDARSMLKLMSDLVNPGVVMSSSLLHLYSTILAAATASLQDNHHKLYSDWLVGSVVGGLCYGGRELSQKKPEELQSLLFTIDQYMGSRDRECTEVLSVWSNEDGRYDDELWLWWEGVGELRAQRWEEVVVPRTYLDFEEVWRKDALPHTIPPLSLPPPPPLLHHPPDEASYLPTCLFPLPLAEFHIFEPSDVPSNLPVLPASNSIERFFVTDTINSLIALHHPERKICAMALLSLDFRCKVPLNYLVIESVFRNMLQTTSGNDDIVRTASLLIELCKLRPDSVPQVLAQATVILYDRLNDMKAHCIDRLARWFALHLSNFAFKWGWDDWLETASLPVLHPKRRFVANTLCFCLRLSYYERVLKIVPDELSCLLPPQPSPQLSLLPSLSDEAKEFGTELMGMFTSRCAVSQVSALLETSPVAGLEKVHVFVHTLLHASSRVISFTLNALARYTNVLKELTQTDKQQDKQQESQERQVQVMLAMHSFWEHKPQMVELLADKLLKTGVVTCQAIITWSFSDVMSPFLSSTYMDRILHGLLDHLHNRLIHHGSILLHASIKRRKSLSMDYSGYDDDDDDEEDDEDDDGRKMRSEDELDAEESRLNGVAQEYRRAHCSVVKKLVERLSDLLPSKQPHLSSLLLHRLHHFLFKHPSYSCRNITYLATSVFTADLEAPILTPFHHFVTLYS